MSNKIKADYRPGRKPVLEDFGEIKARLSVLPKWKPDLDR